MAIRWGVLASIVSFTTYRRSGSAQPARWHDGGQSLDDAEENAVLTHEAMVVTRVVIDSDALLTQSRGGLF